MDLVGPDCQPLDEHLSPDSSRFVDHVGNDRRRRRGESTKAEDDVETSDRMNRSWGRRRRRGVRGLTCLGAGWAGGVSAAGECVGVEGWPGQRHKLGWVIDACAAAPPAAVGRGRKIEQNKEIQMDRWLVPDVCVRDLLV